MAYDFSHLAIYLSKLIKVGGNLTKFWQKQQEAQLLLGQPTVRCYF